MRLRDRLESAESDDYTPATDLVFSLFAMSVLLLAIFAALGRVTGENTKLAFSRDEGNLITSLAERAKCPFTPPADRAALETCIENMVSRQANAANASAYLGHEIWSRLYSDLHDKIAVTGAEPSVNGRFVIQLVNDLKAAQRVVGSQDANEIVLEVASMPDFSQARPMSYAANVALRWGEVLRQEFMRLSWPPGCISVAVNGAWRAGIFSDVEDRMGGLDAIEKRLDWETTARARSQPSSAASAEMRHIDNTLRVILRYSSQSRCAKGILTSFLSAVAK